ncbi:MAG TPA: DUF86 domain-containing protein [Thermodesulfobacteriota bacterium]|nr:DUF86 domain-containing protein [Thermodesulfobacteriota bacterium]
MTNLSVAENKISSIKRYLSILKSYQGYSQKEIGRDVTLRGAIERYLYLVCQAVIDLAEVIISISKFRKPVTLSESFVILAEEKVIADELKDKMVKLVGFRNVLAHEYEELNYEILYDVLKIRLQDIKEFLKVSERFLNLK